MNTISGRGFGTNPNVNRRFAKIPGIFNSFPGFGFLPIVLDDPTVTVNFMAEGVTRQLTFWALGRKAFITIDNTGKPACQIAGAFIKGIAIVPRFSSSVVVQTDDLISQRLYGKILPLELSSQFVNDPTFANDLLLYLRFARMWAERVVVPWYPLIEPGDDILLTNPEYGIVAAAFETTGVNERGFTTEFSTKQVVPSFVI